MHSFTSSVSFPLDSIAFYGRSYDEYLRFFGLQPGLLAGAAVLDVAAGPSSFTAGARERGFAAVAVDPLYGLPPDALAAHVQLDYNSMHARMRSRPEMFRMRTYASLEAAVNDRFAAAARFLADYEAHFAHDRYVGAALPALPFADGAFDVVLCAHLLFLHARHFDRAFHLAALRELVRVARREVRVHPVCGADGQPYPHLDFLRRGLEAEGVGFEERRVEHEFFAGANSTLVLTPAGASRAAICVGARVRAFRG
jgi:hypothetical protein